MNWISLVIITKVHILFFKMLIMKIKTVNPATEEILAEYDALTEDQGNHSEINF